MSTVLGPKAEAFLAALRTLCVTHQVTLAVAGYDSLQIWDLMTGEPLVHCNGIEDCTGIQIAPKDEKDV